MLRHVPNKPYVRMGHLPRTLLSGTGSANERLPQDSSTQGRYNPQNSQIGFSAQRLPLHKTEHADFPVGSLLL
jgi:hypothetical protein